jgi:hypothetical protein
VRLTHEDGVVKFVEEVRGLIYRAWWTGEKDACEWLVQIKKSCDSRAWLPYSSAGTCPKEKSWGASAIL